MNAGTFYLYVDTYEPAWSAECTNIDCHKNAVVYVNIDRHDHTIVASAESVIALCMTCARKNPITDMILDDFTERTIVENENGNAKN